VTARPATPPVTGRPRLLLLAAVLAAVAVGLPWSGPLLGTQHPVRVLALVGIAGVWFALRRGSRPLALAAVAVAALALPMGSWGTPEPGRFCYLVALLVAAAAIAGDRGGARIDRLPSTGS
jgi:hypothetical protein